MKREIYLAGGCFWGMEHYLKQVEGVVETQVGFANGHTEHPTYKEVYTDTTGHAETVRVVYDDEGTRYRTGIYYADMADRPIIDRRMALEQAKCTRPLAVEVEPLAAFYPAEEYHQDYLDKNPTGYCHLPLSLFEFARKARRG